MHRIIITIICLALACPAILADGDKDIHKILDKTAAIIHGSKGTEVAFTATSFTDGEQRGHIQGTIYMKGKKFHIKSENVTSWYDGVTLWSYSKDNNEVNVTIPSVEERQTMNPYLFLALYKQGYNATMTATTLRGIACHEIRLTHPKHRIREMIVDIDAKTNLPLCIRLREDSNYWVRISVKQSRLNQKYKDEIFKFNPKDYPSAEVVDLR